MHESKQFEKHKSNLLPGRGLPYKKDRGARWKYWKEPLAGTRSCFWAWPILKQHIASCFLFFSAQKPNCTTKNVDVLTTITQRGTKTAFLIPERYDDHPCLFYTRVSPPPPPPRLPRAAFTYVSCGGNK